MMVETGDFFSLFQVACNNLAYLKSSPLSSVDPKRKKSYEKDSLAAHIAAHDEFDRSCRNPRLGWLSAGRHGRPHAKIRRCSAIDYGDSRQRDPRGSVDRFEMHPRSAQLDQRRLHHWRQTRPRSGLLPHAGRLERSRIRLGWRWELGIADRNRRRGSGHASDERAWFTASAFEQVRTHR